MRTGMSTIHQTLTPDASAVLNKSMAEASRRRHSQTTPLHVASTLLSFPAGPLRQACVRSHPNSSHPLQCRALDLCFSVALDRLPSSSPSPSSAASPPPLSNALMAALKRAQAHQRRGCPEQQQQPLLAVKVELHQLIVSILDDPSVSRVMREASFSSPAVKLALEQHNPTTTNTATGTISPSTSTRLRPLPNSPLTRGLYLNPRLHTPQSITQPQPIREEEVGKILEVLLREKKRNPVLVGDSDPGILLREVLRRVEKKENVKILSAGAEFENNRSDIPERIRELGISVETQIADGGGVVIDLGDLKWLVESQQPQQLVSEVGRAAVAEMATLLKRLEEQGKVWVIGCASCATYLRCQVYHPTMEADWDLQAVPIAPRAPLPSLFPSTTSAGILSSSVESLTQSRASFAPPHTASTKDVAAAITHGKNTCLAAAKPRDSAMDGMDMCLVCAAGYEKELVKLVVEQPEKPPSSNALPRWLQAAGVDPGYERQVRDQDSQWKQKTELLDRWKQTCSRLHPNANVIRPSLMKGLLEGPAGGPTLLASPPTPEQQVWPPRSPVVTELALGRPTELGHAIRVIKPSDCTLDLLSVQKMTDEAVDPADDSFKRLYKSLNERVAWQPDAAASVATVVAGCRSGGGRRRRNDTWLLFTGPDKVGKRRMAAALSEVMFGGERVVIVSLTGSDDGDSDSRYWGKVAVDRVAEAVKRSPFAVFVLEDIDRADALVQGSIRRAAEKGRLPDSHGREVSLGSGIFVLTSEATTPECAKSPGKDRIVDDERRLESASRHSWQLLLSVEAKTGKRQPERLKEEDERRTRQKVDPFGGLSLDLNLAVGVPEDEPADNSRNSSDVTVELGHAHHHRSLAMGMQPRLLPPELCDAVDEAIVFKHVDFSQLKQKVVDILRGKFELVLGRERAIEIGGATLDLIVGALWFGEAAAGTATGGFDDWVERVILPIFWQLKSRGLAEDGESVVKLVAVDGCKSGEFGGLPDRISITNSN